MSDTATPPAAPAAGRFGAALAGLSAAGSTLPVALLAALPGLVVLAGFDHLAYGIGLLAGVVLAGLLIAPHVARAGAATIPQALDRRFGKGAAVAGAIVIALVVLPLLAAELTFVALLAEATLGLPFLSAVLAALVLSASAGLLLGERAFGWLAVLAYALLAASLLAPLALLAFKVHGIVLPHIAYGEALTGVAAHEDALLENGLVDFDTFAVHVTPFVRLSRLDVVALVLSLALGAAVLPHLVSAVARGARPPVVRLAGAWTALFVMLVLISVPALAAYAKLEIYGAMAAGTPLAELPRWLEAPLAAGLAHIHGTSLAMLDQVAKAVAAGSAEPRAIADSLAGHAPALEQSWRALDEGPRLALLDAGRALGAGASPGALWTAYVGHVLPAAAAAAGNDTATLTQAALVMDPAGLLLALPALSGAPAWIALGLAGAALAVAAALVRALVPLTVSGAPPAGRLPKRACALALAVAVMAAGAAALRPDGLVALAVSALSLGAAGLFPVLALGLAWRRATAAGAIAAILLGSAVTLYYDIGIQAFPAAFYRTWAPLSNAGAFAIEEFEALAAETRDGESAEARSAAAQALETLARGTATRSGLANWFGIDSASSAVFGVPAGFLALLLVSLLTRRQP